MQTKSMTTINPVLDSKREKTTWRVHLWKGRHIHTTENVQFTSEDWGSTTDCIFGPRQVRSTEKSTVGASSMEDRRTEQRAVSTSFVAQKCQPCSITPKELALAKQPSMDKRALQWTMFSSSRTSMTFVSTHGVAATFACKQTERRLVFN